MVRNARLPATVHLSDWQWDYIEYSKDENLPSSQSNTFLKTAIEALQEIMYIYFTKRQLDVFSMYHFESKTQQEIAENLGITQPTVHQHLHGKWRNGHRIGGAHRKIRKNASKPAYQKLLPPEKAQVIEILLSFG
jgi:predicted XRE-type DNA-binding protein